MVNLTVISKKDITKYLIKFIIISGIIIFLTKYLMNLSNNTKMPELISKFEFTGCLDDTIPAIKQVNNENIDSEDYIEKIDPSKLVIGMQLSMLENLKNKEEIKDENINEKENIYNETTTVEHAQIGLNTQVIENNVQNRFTNGYNGVQVKNETEYELTDDILNPNIDINNKDIMIFHTHTCESYTSSQNYEYAQNGTYRTTDYNFNVVRVGAELENQLKSYNYNVIHDKTYHDYPAYTGSYGRSLETVENILKTNQNTDIVFDIHRDAIGDYSYAPTVKIGEEYAAQLMFVIGTEGGGLSHPNWNQNLKFAIKIQQKANELYPGLFKPIILRNSRYNQHLTKAASIIEVGATGNTMDQCINSMKYLAKVISEVI